ncbi:hypothetical protein E8E11_008789 [Didymella keratinophila]|nr:hypothetical protein E8E11_008789 [Didymella keratinophila]
MTDPPSTPYLTASLNASSSDLDLSGATPFSLSLTVTLHAPRPILLYTADTFLCPSAALRSGSIDFFRVTTAEKLPAPLPDSLGPVPLPRSTLHVCGYGGPERPWVPREFLRLDPGVLRVINIPFGSRSHLGEKKEERQFDVRFWFNTAGFETGGKYTAVLQEGGRVSWWRWAGGDGEVYEDAAALEGVSVWRMWWRWMWKGKGGEGGGVPVMPVEEQISIHILEGDGRIDGKCFPPHPGDVGVIRAYFCGRYVSAQGKHAC